MDLGLTGKRAIVTGASRGIGLAVAQALAAEGVQVAMVARGADELRVAAEGVGTAFPADTTDDASVRTMVADVIGAFGGIDILINAAARPAGGTTPPTLAEISDDDVRIEVETKVLGYLRTARAVAPHLVEQGWGRIVNVSGLNARHSGSIAGSMRNVAVAALTKNLGDELGPHGVNVTVVHPGITVTERTPGMLERRAAADGITVDEAEARFAAPVSIGRLVTAAEVADVVVFLCSPRSVAINGDALAVGGGTRGAIHY
ncbi:SDR family NAD(P)-dependent oxidoreductase [uncultured Jatrophihabitans sp.]|uniref:SDR family NAD(P)-dependent oxidoreductase n=1 Tax=uncultured Jatrophihabitans sp. TaxID=1610747 RepID=UPI0035CBD31D